MLQFSPTFKIRIRFFRSLNLFIYNFLNGKPPTFSLSEAREKNRASKNFRLYPHNFCDILKLEWGRLPLRMTFYSTKIPD
ncbi:MAG: hypothetical protein F6K39_10940 [Okeania sp. SIO3B3]|nr:hypothetical protein [Okeania sp. SIO3B3]